MSMGSLLILRESFQSLVKETLLKGKALITVDLLVAIVLDQLLFLLYLINKTIYVNEEVNCTDPSPSVSVLCL